MQPGQPSETAQYVAYLRALGNLAPQVPGFTDAVAERLLPSVWRRRVDRARVRLARPCPFWPRQRPASPYSLWHRGIGLFNQFRSVELDRTLAAAAPFPQLVILGAGLDGRAWRLPGLASVRVFEVDHPDTQAWKRQQGAALPAMARELRFVPVDFARDDLAQALRAAGHASDQATFWLWEGVTPYLDADTVARTLAVTAACSAPGSGLAVTYMATRNGQLPASFFTATLGEPCRSAYTPATWAAAAARAGWSTGSDTGIADWTRELLPPGQDLGAGSVGLQWCERIWVGRLAGISV